MTTIPEPTPLVHDHVGQLVVFDGIVYYLTPCCGASAKGSGDGQTVCRKCYCAVDPQLGDGWPARDTDSWTLWERAWSLSVPADAQRAVHKRAMATRLQAESAALVDWSALS